MDELDDSSPARDSRRFMAGVAAGFVLLSAVASILVSNALGMSLWWDTFNYEYYNGWALLHGFGSSFGFPGQIQTYFDPIPNTGYYLALSQLKPLYASQVIAFVESLGPALLATLVFTFARRVERSRIEAMLLGLAAGGLAFMTAVYIKELGTTASDTILAAGLFAGAGLLCAAALRHGTRARSMFSLAAGVILGATMMIKLIAAPIVIGLLLGFGLALLLGREQREPLRAKVITILTSCAAALLTASVLYAPFGVMLWRRYRNPFFPFLSSLVGSPVQHSRNFQPGYSVVHGPADWVMNLKKLLVGSTQLEGGGYIHRSPILVVGFLILLGLLIHDMFWRRGTIALILETAGVVSFIAWSSTLVIHRYAAPIEMAMSAMLIILALDRWPKQRLVVWGVGLACLLGVLGGTAGLSSRMSFADDLFGVDVATLQRQNTGHLVIAARGEAIGYLATYLPVSTDIVRFGGNLNDSMTPAWWAAAAAHVRSTPGPWKVLIIPGAEHSSENELHHFGVTARITSCLPLGGRAGHQVSICDLSVGTS